MCETVNQLHQLFEAFALGYKDCEQPFNYYGEAFRVLMYLQRSGVAITPVDRHHIQVTKLISSLALLKKTCEQTLQVHWQKLLFALQ